MESFACKRLFESCPEDIRGGDRSIQYELALINKEVHIMFENMIQDWFSGNDDYNAFIMDLCLD